MPIRISILLIEGSADFRWCQEDSVWLGKQNCAAATSLTLLFRFYSPRGRSLSVYSSNCFSFFARCSEEFIKNSAKRQIVRR